MNNIQDEEKDLFIRQKLNKDKLISKKYDDVFETFLKGEHEMKQEKEPEIEAKDERTKKQKKSWVKPFAAVAACALIFTGANVYATTQGYDNIFFLIKDLGNKKSSVAQKDEILTDVDTTISYTNIEIADGLMMQINKFVVKDGKASLFVIINQENASVIPDKFIVSSNGVNLANETIQEKKQVPIAKSYDSKNNEYVSQYSYEIKLNDNYKDNMKVLTLRIDDMNSVEIATLEIDLKNREIDLLSGSNNSKEVKKISEIDLKEKLGAYTIMLNPYNYNYTSDIEKLYLGIFLTTDVTGEKAQEASDGFKYYPREKINTALKEALGEELGTKVDSDEFEYNKELDAYKFIDTREMLTRGLCLNIDDVKFEDEKYSVTFTYCMPDDQDYTNGTIEDLDRFKTTLDFTLNENETYTKYKVLNINSVVSEIVNSNTEDYGIIDNSKYQIEDMESLEDSDDEIFVSVNKPDYDVNTIDNYASTMEWTEYWAPGIKFQYPTYWEFSDVPRDGGKGIQVNAESTGWAVGINRETNEPIESYMNIEVYEPTIVLGTDNEDAARNFADSFRFELTGASYTNEEGQEWYICNDASELFDDSGENSYYICITEFGSADEPTGEYRVDMIRFVASDYSYKVTNIIDRIIGTAKLTSY